MNWIKRHRETLIVMLLGLLVVVSLNVAMLQYNYDIFTNPKVGFYSAFTKRFEISGFDPYVYIVLSKWRPLFSLFRHPLLSFMVLPFSQLNALLMDHYGINCSIFIAAALWVLMSMCSWMLMYKILRKVIRLDFSLSLLLTLFYFGFSHVMLMLFVPDHMAITQLLLLLTIWLACKAIERGKTMPLWQSLPLAVLSMGVTTTNIVKIVIADFFTSKSLFRVKGWGRLLCYIFPFLIVGSLYVYQKNTTQAEESKQRKYIVHKKMENDSIFAAQKRNEVSAESRKKHRQIIDSKYMAFTEYHIDRFPSLQENIFGEGILLHERFTLRDTNKEHRPALVRYSHWWDYLFEVCFVALFVIGAWIGRRNRLMQMTLMMFLFDMILHVGLNFASADVYIMTAHWAFVVPIAVAYLMKEVQEKHRGAFFMLLALLCIMTAFMWIHNLRWTAIALFAKNFM